MIIRTVRYTLNTAVSLKGRREAERISRIMKVAVVTMMKHWAGERRHATQRYRVRGGRSNDNDEYISEHLLQLSNYLVR